MHYSCVHWVNERDVALSIQEPFSLQCFFELRRGKKPLMLILHKTTIWRWLLFQWAQWQSRLTAVTLLMHAGPSEKPQLCSTCGTCPTFHSSTCMYAHVCVWHQYVRGGLSSCVQWRSSEGDQLKVTVWELRWAGVRSVAKPDTERALSPRWR